MKSVDWQNYFKSPYHMDEVFIFHDNGILMTILCDNKELVENAFGVIFEGKENKDNAIFSLSKNKEFILRNNKYFLKCRGWGYLTGTGGCNLDYSSAVVVQNEFMDYATSKLREKELSVQNSLVNLTDIYKYLKGEDQTIFSSEQECLDAFKDNLEMLKKNIKNPFE